jgi:putative tryptophan/tyrosine transport system substrate-binding protein
MRSSLRQTATPQHRSRPRGNDRPHPKTPSSGRSLMRRREFIAGLCGAAAWSLAAWPGAALGQQSQMRRIGFLTAGEANQALILITVLQQELRKLGWTAGENIQIEARWADGETSRVRAQAAELVRLNPDLLVASGVLALTALLQETRTIPIVFAFVSDPVEQGFVASLARPGGNITGTTLFEFSLAGKYLELLKEIAPDLARVALLHSPDVASSAGYLRSIETAARPVGVQTTAAPVVNESEIERAIEKLVGEANSGLIVLPSSLFAAHRRLIIGLAARHHLPAIYTSRRFVEAGGLMSYGTNPTDDRQWRIAVSYVNRILRGEKPADLPVQQPTNFEFVLNLKTAKALGVTVPTSILLRADEVIE